MSDSSSSAGRSLVTGILVLGGIVWLIQHLLTDSPAPAPVPVQETQISTSKAAIDFSQTKGEALNSSMNDQLKSVQQMVGGDYDGKTYVPPKSRQ